MPNIVGVGSFTWPEKHKDLLDSFEMFWVIMKCPDCGHEWEWKPSKADFNGVIADVVIHRERGQTIAFEGRVSLDCPSCDGVARFMGGLHEDGGVFITSYWGSFDDEWWNAPYGES